MSLRSDDLYSIVETYTEDNFRQLVVAARDPYALRALVLIACIATFVAARGERWKRIATAFDWKASCCRLVTPPRR